MNSPSPVAHTPGPWRIGDAGQTIFGPKTADGSLPSIVAAKIGKHTNARLIAEAPAMLAELREAERVIRWAIQESAGRVKAEIVGGWKHHADKIRSAIARAIG